MAQAGLQRTWERLVASTAAGAQLGAEEMGLGLGFCFKLYHLVTGEKVIAPKSLWCGSWWAVRLFPRLIC